MLKDMQDTGWLVSTSSDEFMEPAKSLALVLSIAGIWFYGMPKHRANNPSKFDLGQELCC
jgi:hypothetical protein